MTVQQTVLSSMWALPALNPSIGSYIPAASSMHSPVHCSTPLLYTSLNGPCTPPHLQYTNCVQGGQFRVGASLVNTNATNIVVYDGSPQVQLGCVEVELRVAY